MQMRAASVAFADKTAFVLNANARAVTARLVTQLREIVPQGDLFLSRSLDDARSIAETIVRRGYGQVMTGGGDGTLLSTINFLEEHAEKIGAPMPKVGVLRLGTGNAVAGLMGAGDPLVTFRYDQAWEFIDAIHNQRPCVPSFHDGARMQAVIDAALQSAEKRQWVDVPA